MRMSILGLLALSLSACAPAWPPMPYAHQASLPYAACGNMATLRANLTGNPDVDAGERRHPQAPRRALRRPNPPPAIRARY